VEVTEVSSREFNRDFSRLKKLASKGPVVIKDRGVPSHVLLSYRDYEALKGSRGKSLLQAIAQHGPADDTVFDPPPVRIDSRGADLG
jgi:prevent-host-death family protein